MTLLKKEHSMTLKPDENKCLLLRESKYMVGFVFFCFFIIPTTSKIFIKNSVVLLLIRKIDSQPFSPI